MPPPGSDGWCAAQFWLGWTAQYSADLAGALGHFTALRDAVAERGPSRALADGLAGRSMALPSMGRYAEAADEARRSLAVAREARLPGRGGAGPGGSQRTPPFEAGDLDDAVRLARQAEQITAGVPGSIARCVRARPGRRADRGRGPGRRRARLRGEPWPGPATRATC